MKYIRLQFGDSEQFPITVGDKVTINRSKLFTGKVIFRKNSEVVVESRNRRIVCDSSEIIKEISI